jgi:predicted alpha/beta superfamily hydrolase
MRFAGHLTMRCALLAAAFAALPNAVSATAAPADVADAAPYTIPRSATYQLAAPDGEQYEVMVAWPAGAPLDEGWPALYTLDGEDNFAITALTARRLARAGARSGIGEGIVVSIAAGPLARRVRDFTPLVPGYRIPAGKPAAGLETDVFLNLLTSTVMPSVAKRWPVNQGRERLRATALAACLPCTFT